MKWSKWQRKVARDKKVARKATIERRRNLRTVVRLIAKIITPMREHTQWQRERVRVIRKALDVLAGEAASG